MVSACERAMQTAKPHGSYTFAYVMLQKSLKSPRVQYCHSFTCVTLGKLLNFSQFRLPPLRNGCSTL